MWLPKDVVAAVDRVARIHYVSMLDTARWNATRHDNELRLFTGWCWVAKTGGQFRQGLKTVSCCYRDAFYTLIAKTEAPGTTRPRLRIVGDPAEIGRRRRLGIA